MRLSPRFTDKDWKGINFSMEDGWQQAVAIVEDRIEGRWLRWVDGIVSSQFSGFAVLALDCIVLESLWGFANGKAVPKRHEREVYRKMLSGRRFRWPDAQIDDFREFVRNGLMHDAETRNRWLVEMTIPRNRIAEQNAAGDYVINRSKFHRAVRGTFEDWLHGLRSGDGGLRRNMRARMDEIIAKHYAP